MKSILMASSALAMLATPAFAQEAKPADDGAIQEIVVTAQKRTERLQDVPVAVSVLSGETLTKLGAVNIEGAQRLVPSLTFLKGGTSLNSSLFLRGVGTINFSIAAEPSVSTVLDGVVLARAGEGFGDLYDLERIEVLRGPQGTLFGKNASAGVVNIITKKPSDTLEGYVDLGYFSGKEYKAKASISGPLSDGVRARVTGFYGSYDGNITNLTRGTKVNGYERYGARAVIEADAGENLKLTFAADYRKSDDDCCAEVIGTRAGNATAAILPTPLGDRTRSVIQNLITATKETAWGVSLQADLSLGDYTLTSITAYRNWKNREIRDGDWVDQAYVGINQLHDDGPEKANTFTQELRLASPAGKPFEYVVGAFYYRAKAQRVFTRNVIQCSASTSAPIAAGLTPCLPGTSTTLNPIGSANFGSTFDNIAVFGQATYHVSDAFRLIGGLRYTHDKLDVFLDRVSNFADNRPGIRPNFSFRGNTSRSNLSGKAGAQLDLRENVMAYATFSRGYKGPAYNVFFNQYKSAVPPLAGLAGIDDTNVINAETVNSYEVGLKNSFAGGRVILNLAGFYAKYKNYQANNPDVVAGVPTTRLQNAGTVSTRGFEADWLVRLARSLTVTGGVAYTKAKVDQFQLPFGANPAQLVPTGTPLPFSSKLKGSLGVNYTIEAPSLPFDVELGTQMSFQDKQLAGFSPVAAVRQQLTIPAYEQVDLSIAALGHDDRYRVAFVVRNLFDKSYPATITAGGPGGALRYIIPRDADRYFGVTAKINFGGK